MDHIPLVIALSRRGVTTSSTYCYIYSNGEESTDRLLIKCNICHETLGWIFRRFGLLVQIFDSVTKVIKVSLECLEGWERHYLQQHLHISFQDDILHHHYCVQFG